MLKPSKRWGLYKMKISLLFLLVTGLLLSGCENASTSIKEKILSSDDQVQQQPFPFKIDPTKSGAYIGRDYMSVYLVGESNVLIANFDLPETKTTSVRILIGMDKANSITHYTGPDIEKYVLPQGAQRPIPVTPDYQQKKSISGLISCWNAPVKGLFEYGREIDLSLEQIDFGDGKLYQIKPMKMIVDAFPP